MVEWKMGWRLAALIGLAGLAAGGAAAAESRSSFGCNHLEDQADPAVVEGADGVFFTILDDIAMQPVADPAMVDNIAALSQRLLARGTILVYVPIPSKSQAMPGAVPQAAWLYGYQEAVNAGVYDEAIERLEAAGVVTADVQKAMRGSRTPPFQQADNLWTADGARLAAGAIAERLKDMPEYRKAPLMVFTTVKTGEGERSSELRTAIQAYCTETIPPVVDTTYETTGTDAFAADRPFNILGAEAPAPVVLVGSRFSANGQSHFDGFLEEASGLAVDNRAAADSYPFRSIADYLASTDYQQKPPLFLVWEVPAGSNLARFGPVPWQRLEADAAGDCAAANATCGGNGEAE